MRLPFMWCGFFLVGFFCRHVVVEGGSASAQTERIAYSPSRRAACVKASAYVGTVACVALGATMLFAIFGSGPFLALSLPAKDVYLAALPCACALFGASRARDPSPQGEGALLRDRGHEAQRDDAAFDRPLLEPRDRDGSRQADQGPSSGRALLVYGDASPTLRRAAKALVEELSRCSYFIYLYHGFFLDRESFGPENTWARAALVLSTTFALSQLADFLAKPEVAAAYFGITPRRGSRQTKSQRA